MKRLKSFLVHHTQAARSSLSAVSGHPFATAMTVLVIAITLALPALFWVMSDNMRQLVQHGPRLGHMSLYLKISLSATQANETLMRVRETPGVAEARLITPEEGLAELEQQEGMHDIRRYLPDNPLPAVIEVVPALGIHTPAQLEQLYLQLKAYKEVDQAKLDMAWVNRFQAISEFVHWLAQALMGLLALAVLLIIGNTLRLAIHNRHEEIQVYKLMGARDAFIVRPFLYLGIYYGLAGAFVAVLLVDVFLWSTAMAVNQLARVYEMQYALVGLTFRQTTLLLLAAVILGWLGASLSVKRQLAGIEPCK